MRILVIHFSDDNFGDMLIEHCFSQLLNVVSDNLKQPFEIHSMGLKNFNQWQIENSDLICFAGGGVFGLSYLNLFEHINAILSVAEEKQIPVITLETWKAESDEDFEKIYQNLDKFEKIKEILSTGELIFSPYRDIDDNILSGDLTGLVTCQIKAVERYLKEIIIRYARSKGKWIETNGKDINLIDSTPQKMIIKNNENYYVVKIDENSNAMNLSSINPGISTTVDIGPCIKFIKENISNSKQSIFNYNEKISDCPLHKNWVNQVRNPHMHVTPVESLSDAKKILAKTAYWLLRIIDELDDMID